MPHSPLTPCTEIAPTGSSMRRLPSMKNTATQTNTPAMPPISTADGALPKPRRAARHVPGGGCAAVRLPMTQRAVLGGPRWPRPAPGPCAVDRGGNRADEDARHAERRHLPPLRQRPGRDPGRGIHEDHLEQEV